MHYSEVGIGNEKKYTGVLSAIRKIYRTNGITGLYKGLFPALFATFLPSFLDVPTQKDFDVKDKTFEDTLINSLGLFFGITLPWPFVMISIRLQMDSDRMKPLYKGTVDCAKKIIMTEGYAALFTGYRITIPYHVFSQACFWHMYSRSDQYKNKD